MFKTSYEASEKKLIGKNIDKNKYDDALLNGAINYYFSKMNLDGFEGAYLGLSKKVKNNVSIKVKDKWGEGFTDDEYRKLEDKYLRYSRSFSVENEAQNDYLIKACIASFKADKAMTGNSSKEAETWMNIYDKAMKAGKLQPVQLSASDMLSGVVTFSQFFELVEKSGFIPPLPNIVRDDVDYAIWRFINYNRELLDLPPIELGNVVDIMTYDYESGQELLPLDGASQEVGD